ncbi:hypothetical protein PUN28_007900 [Cardiocondyla obscurior]|uniref:Uncharacterized protein n=1 Tax=Cardiocondyla obscurior TaxID=286306 RepID=A0AAW2G173_9HYME
MPIANFILARKGNIFYPPLCERFNTTRRIQTQILFVVQGIRVSVSLTRQGLIKFADTIASYRAGCAFGRLTRHRNDYASIPIQPVRIEVARGIDVTFSNPHSQRGYTLSFCNLLFVCYVVICIAHIFEINNTEYEYNIRFFILFFFFLTLITFT